MVPTDIPQRLLGVFAVLVIALGVMVSVLAHGIPEGSYVPRIQVAAIPNVGAGLACVACIVPVIAGASDNDDDDPPPVNPPENHQGIMLLAVFASLAFLAILVVIAALGIIKVVRVVLAFRRRGEDSEDDLQSRSAATDGGNS